MDKIIETILEQVKVGDISLLDFLTATQMCCDFMEGFGKEIKKEKEDEIRYLATSAVCGALVQLTDAKSAFDEYVSRSYPPKSPAVQEMLAKATLNSLPRPTQKTKTPKS